MHGQQWTILDHASQPWTMFGHAWSAVDYTLSCIVNHGLCLIMHGQPWTILDHAWSAVDYS